MIIILFSVIIQVSSKAFDEAKAIYPDFGKVMEGRGYIPSIDFIYAERIYKINDDRENPFIAFALGEIQRLQKKKHLAYYREAIKRTKTISQIFILDLLFSKRNIFELDGEITARMQKILSIKNKKADIKLAKKYETLAIDEFLQGNSKRAIYLMSHASFLAPMLRRLHLEGVKMSLASWNPAFFTFLTNYIVSIKYINNRYVFFYNLFIVLVFLFIFISVSLLFAGFVDGESFLARVLRLRTPFRAYWISGITWALFVFLPLKIFAIVAFFISILRLGKKRGIFTGGLLTISALILLGLNPFKYFLNDENNKNMLLAFYDPVHVNFEPSKKNAFSMWLYGEKLLREGQNRRAREIFRSIRVPRSYRDEIYNNIGVSYFLEGEYDSAFVYFNRALEKDKNNPTYIFNLAKTYTNLLDFEKASSYFSKLKGSQKKQAEILFVSPPLSLLKLKLKGKNNSFPLNTLIILSTGLILLALSTPQKSKGDLYCSVCGTILVISLELEEKKVCEKCYIALAQSHSKGIRERIKKRIKKKTETILEIKNYIYNLIFPGLSHLSNGFYINGIFYSILYVLLLTIRFSDKLLITESGYHLPTIEGSLLWFILMILFFIFLIISTGRVSEYGSGRRS